ncbi:MAG TPA: hypothetical protein VJQ45_06705 [Ktedonobacterales bacterium]|nr:hypothetical protein [Ktedonobacterales bacterium]
MQDGDHSSAGDDAETPDAVELEVSDLTPRSPDAFPPRPRLPRLDALRARRVRLLLASATALVLAAVLIVAARPAVGGSVAALLAVPTPTVTPLPTPLPSATPFPTPTPYPTPTFSPLTTLGPAPQDCPSGPAPQTISQAFGPAVGGGPVWVSGDFSASGNPLTLHAVETLPDARTLYGWPAPLLVSESSQDTRPFSLQARNASTGTVLWFNVQAPTSNGSNNGEVNTVLLSFDPAQGNAFAGGFVNWFPILYIPAPGCYVMEVAWSGGAWTIPFAAGA